MPLAYSYIRFSTKEQAKGDSLRRQTDLREAYLKSRLELTLDNSLTLKDLGVSAFKGANADEGTLGTFITAIDEGIVPKGSYLLVESLDRLSRAKVVVALDLFLRIIRKGITIATLEDGREYSEQSISNNFTDLIVSIAIMARAHEESQRKSNLISNAWKQKRVDAAKTGKVMSKVVPFWLKAKDDKSGFDVIPELAEVLNRMFDLCLSGLGVHSIAKILNNEGKTTATGKAWKGPNIAKFLNNRAAIGEATFSSFMNKESKREATEPIPNYFPAVISEDKFYAVRDKFSTWNMSTEHGNKSDNRNLFRRLVTCPYCGNTISLQAMRYKTREGTKLYSTLACSGQVNGNGCIAKRWDYYEVQRLFLNYVRELNVTTLVGSDQKAEEIKAVKELIAKERLSHEQLSAKLNNLMNLVEEGVKLEGVAKRMYELESQIATSEITKLELERDLSRLEAETRSFESTRESMNTLIELLGDPEHSPKPYHIMEEVEVQRRARLTMMVASLVERIQLYSVGLDLKSKATEFGLDESKFPSYDKEFRYMLIKFKSGLERALSWNGISYTVENGQFVGDTWFGKPWPQFTKASIEKVRKKGL